MELVSVGARPRGGLRRRGEETWLRRGSERYPIPSQCCYISGASRMQGPLEARASSSIQPSLPARHETLPLLPSPHLFLSSQKETDHSPQSYNALHSPCLTLPFLSPHLMAKGTEEERLMGWTREKRERGQGGERTWKRKEGELEGR